MLSGPHMLSLSLCLPLPPFHPCPSPCSCTRVLSISLSHKIFKTKQNRRADWRSEERAFESGKLVARPLWWYCGASGGAGCLNPAGNRTWRAWLALSPERSLGFEGVVFLWNAVCPCWEHARDSIPADWNWTDCFFPPSPTPFSRNFFRQSMKSVTGSQLNKISWGFSQSQNYHGKGPFSSSHMLGLGFLRLRRGMLGLLCYSFLSCPPPPSQFNSWFCAAWLNCAYTSKCWTRSRTAFLYMSCTWWHLLGGIYLSVKW